MQRGVTRAGVWLWIAVLGAAGCQTTGSYLLSTIGLKEKPLGVALVLEQNPGAAAAALNPFPRYTGLQRALSEDLNRPVAVDPCFQFQAQHGLNSGWYSAAVMTAAQYAALPSDVAWPVLAVPVDLQGRAAREAVLIVRARSDVQAVADLRGRIVAFGPRGDPRTHHAALQCLRQAGLKKTDLQLELLPVPLSLKHMPDARSVAQTVMNDSSAAGFIDIAAWEQLPEHQEADDQPARDQFRVIARTAALPGRLVVASPQLDQATTDRVRRALLAMSAAHPEALKALEIAGYRTPDAELLTACRELIVEPASEAPKATDAPLSAGIQDAEAGS